MCCTDRQPLAKGPAAERIQAVANNRLGAVYSALYNFWSARDAAVAAGQRAFGAQRRFDTVNPALYNLTYGLATFLVLPATKKLFSGDGILTASYSSIARLKLYWSTISQARRTSS